MDSGARPAFPPLLKSHPQADAVEGVLTKLISAGHRALLAGGCVRDLHLNRVAQDLDVATSATPDEVERLFPKTVAVGKAFGVILVVENGHEIEVATFRKDGTYSDGRRPDAVVFSDEKEDALRRDFTVNALFWDPVRGETLDYVEGLADLRDRRLRTVGEAHRRFSEDQLRLLRAVRFSLQLDFEMEPITAQAVRELAPEIRHVSGERIRDELLKCARFGQPARTLALLEEAGLLKAIFPAWAAKLPKEVGGKSWPKAPWAPDEAAAARLFAPLIVAAGGGEDGFFARWRGPRSEEKFLRTAWKWLRDEPLFWSLRDGQKLKLWAEPAVLEGLFLAAVLKTEAAPASTRAALETRYRSIAVDGALPAPLLRGQDLTTMAQGPALGKALDEAYLAQLEGRFSDKGSALTYVHEWMKLKAP